MTRDNRNATLARLVNSAPLQIGIYRSAYLRCWIRCEYYEVPQGRVAHRSWFAVN